MLIYRLIADSNNYQSIIPIGETDYDFFESLAGKRLVRKPNQINVYRLTEHDSESDLTNIPLEGDFPFLTSAMPTLSERAWKILSPYINKLCETIPVVEFENKIPSRETGVVWQALNVFAIPNIFDERNSKIEYFYP